MDRYWNWALDATVESMPKSPLFDTVSGFGGKEKTTIYEQHVRAVAVKHQY